jgi:hypothetical protein
MGAGPSLSKLRWVTKLDSFATAIPVTMTSNSLARRDVRVLDSPLPEDGKARAFLRMGPETFPRLLKSKNQQPECSAKDGTALEKRPGPMSGLK